MEGAPSSNMVKWVAENLGDDPLPGNLVPATTQETTHKSHMTMADQQLTQLYISAGRLCWERTTLLKQSTGLITLPPMWTTFWKSKTHTEG